MKNNLYSRCPKFLKNYFDFLQNVKKRTSSTIEGYYNDIIMFLRFLLVLHGNGSLEVFDSISILEVPLEWLNELTKDQLDKFVDFVKSRSIKDPKRSLNRKLVSLHQLYLFLLTEFHDFRNRVPLTYKILQVVIDPPKPIKDKHMKKIERWLQNPADVTNYRNYYIIFLFVRLGLKLDELHALNINDYDRSQHTLSIGKGFHHRIIDLRGEYHDVEKILQEAISLHRGPCEALFLSNTSCRMHKRRIQQVVTEFFINQNLAKENYTAKNFRDTFGVNLARAGADIHIIKHFLGVDRNTAARYLEAGLINCNKK